MCQAWHLSPVTQALSELGQEDFELKSSLGYIAMLYFKSVCVCVIIYSQHLFMVYFCC